ncbi:hypothetical protein B566_EDAN004890 [Ephemera danica]|nr:hypothetical protein B566_EDAN004890 [Ephemera danica]
MAPGGGGSGVGGGAGGGGAPVSRGAMRGRRMLAMEIIHTRPAHMANKQGNNGNVIDLQANYFKLGTVTNWIVNQFRVDFAPEIDHVGLRKGLVKDHKNTLGGYMFDGSVLYCCHRFATDPLELFSTCKGETTPVQIKIRFVRIPQFNLELWPGYLTSIRQHEQQIMMCAEVTHKIMRMETVLDLYREVQQRCRPDELTHAFKSAALGLVVLTDYNNRTYRIDDIDYEVTPKATFAKKDGTLISYYEYYRTRYNLSIKNPDQPLLVSKSKARELRAGAQETVYLVPELCRMTGLTDRMRENFQLMRALAEHTRVGPGIRMQKLMHFNNRLQGVPEVKLVASCHLWSWHRNENKLTSTCS